MAPQSNLTDSLKAQMLFAHGAGAGSDSSFIQTIAHLMRLGGLGVKTFDFPYMARMKQEGRRLPPDRAPKLLTAFEEEIKQAKVEFVTVDQGKPFILAGKSMGGRMATMLAAEQPHTAQGVVVFGYPFHPRAKPEKLRTEHFADLQVPTLIIQGTRDPMGSRELVDQLSLPDMIRICWLEDGDHDLKPRRASGYTHDQHMETAAKAAAEFTLSLDR